jgi:putative exosortase-associated protein (TIGR04073 family)
MIQAHSAELDAPLFIGGIMKKISWLMAMFIAALCFSPMSYAGEGTAGDYVTGMGKNIGRGLWNVVSSPAEIPCTIGSELSVRPAAGFFTGLGLGLVYMLRRIVVGVSEIGTFVMPSEATLPPVCQASA